MDENNWDINTLQAVLNYYRTKSYQLEYEFILYKTTNEKRLRELSLELEKFYNREDSVKPTSKNTKQRKSDEKNDKK